MLCSKFLFGKEHRFIPPEQSIGVGILGQRQDQHWDRGRSRHTQPLPEPIGVTHFQHQDLHQGWGHSQGRDWHWDLGWAGQTQPEPKPDLKPEPVSAIPLAFLSGLC